MSRGALCVPLRGEPRRFRTRARYVGTIDYAPQEGFTWPMQLFCVLKRTQCHIDWHFHHHSWPYPLLMSRQAHDPPVHFRARLGSSPATPFVSESFHHGLRSLHAITCMTGVCTPHVALFDGANRVPMGCQWGAIDVSVQKCEFCVIITVIVLRPSWTIHQPFYFCHPSAIILRQTARYVDWLRTVSVPRKS